ncbi:hypothetical protein NDU88_011372 [Pleurodeles waltl]|uniref:Uncharacterized protein n=1 Tax=Pleurodeles waltl TaxID=8319 RepID=A0AAV7PY19_PLEWA|nr:hypothetical protein NDU88_011372 [Pleurodeles waltl]
MSRMSDPRRGSHAFHHRTTSGGAGGAGARGGEGSPGTARAGSAEPQDGARWVRGATAEPPGPRGLVPRSPSPGSGDGDGRNRGPASSRLQAPAVCASPGTRPYIGAISLSPPPSPPFN